MLPSEIAPSSSRSAATASPVATARQAVGARRGGERRPDVSAAHPIRDRRERPVVLEERADALLEEEIVLRAEHDAHAPARAIARDQLRAGAARRAVRAR